MKLSIIIPVFNEESTITSLLKQVLAVNLLPTVCEIIVVDDASTDTSWEKLQAFKDKKKLRLYRHEKNAGKGGAVVTGMRHATGEYILIQDADLEYNPQQIPTILKPILTGDAEVVYGTRLKRLPNMREDAGHHFLLIHYFGNRFLSLVTSMLYGQWITDMETCYKLFPSSALQHVTIHSKGFAFEPEITAKLLKSGYKIHEVKIKTTPRGYGEGKKLNALKEGPIALWTLIKYRFVN